MLAARLGIRRRGPPPVLVMHIYDASIDIRASENRWRRPIMAADHHPGRLVVLWLLLLLHLNDNVLLLILLPLLLQVISAEQDLALRLLGGVDVGCGGNVRRRDVGCGCEHGLTFSGAQQVLHLLVLLAGRRLALARRRGRQNELLRGSGHIDPEVLLLCCDSSLFCSLYVLLLIQLIALLQKGVPLLFRLTTLVVDRL